MAVSLVWYEQSPEGRAGADLAASSSCHKLGDVIPTAYRVKVEC